MIKTLSYITKINSILQYSNSLLVTLNMKNIFLMGYKVQKILELSFNMFNKK